MKLVIIQFFEPFRGKERFPGMTITYTPIQMVEQMVEGN